MKAIQLGLLFLFITSMGQAQENSLEKVFAIESIQTIKVISSVEQKALRRDNFNISPEIISFEVYAQLFEAGQKIKQTYPPNIILRRDSALIKFGGKMRLSNVKIFFSEMRGGEFFVEVIRMNSKNEASYDKRPDFGISEVFLFSIEGRKVRFVRSQKLNYL